MAQQVILQNQQNIEEGGGQRHEEIPLNRLTSSEERAERRRMRQIFDEVCFIYFIFINSFYCFGKN